MSTIVLIQYLSDARNVLVETTFDVSVKLPNGPTVRARRMDSDTGISLTAEFTVTLADAVAEDFRYLSESRLPNRASPLPWENPPVQPGSSLVCADQPLDGQDDVKPRTWAVPDAVLPDDTLAVVQQIRTTGRDAVMAVTRFVVWRYYRTGAHVQPSGSARCSLDDGKSWFSLPMGLKGEMVASSAVPWEANSGELQRLVEAWREVPAAYPLLWEARAMASPNARLALTITALEVGTKAFIVLCDPNADWLMTNLQTPPVFRLLKEYLPHLAPPSGVEQRCSAPPRRVLSAIKHGVEERNKLLHRGKPFPRSRLSELDAAVEWTLRLLDSYAGETWSAWNMRLIDLEAGDDPPKKRTSRLPADTT